MGWLGRLFDRRDTWVRLVLLDLSGVSYLLFGGDIERVTTTTQWVLAIIAFVTMVALSRHPAINLVVQTALLAVAFILIDDATINVVGSSWALGELVVWAAGTRLYVLGIALLTGVHLALDVLPGDGRLRSEIFALIIPIGIPVLLGLVVRTSRELGSQARQRVVEEQLRRESESRAARADERSAIARELHDVVAHHVASMVLRVGVARHVLPGLDPKVASVLDDVHGTGTAALADLRRLVAVLRDPGEVRDAAAFTAIDPGALPDALGAAVDTARRAGLTVEAEIDEAVGAIDAVRGLAVLRLTQEALTNVAKHAGPSAHARLRVTVEDDNVTWEVADDGGAGRTGNNAPPQVFWSSVPSGGPGIGSGHSHGIVGMRERVEVLGGVLSVGPDGRGWRVGTVLPAHSGAAA